MFSKYPQWFIDELTYEEDKKRAIDGTLKTRDIVYVTCPVHGPYKVMVGHRFKLLSKEVNRECPMCNRAKKRVGFPQWFIDELAHEEDKERARKGVLSSNAVVEFVCPEHGVYERKVKSRIEVSTGKRKAGCPLCKKVIEPKYSYPQWFIDELAHEEDKRRARDNTLRSSDMVDFVCPEHGVYNQKVGSHIKLSTGEQRVGCYICGGKYKAPYPQWFIDELANEEDKQRARDNTISSSEVLKFVCPVHGIYEHRVGYHIKMSTGERRYGCVECANMSKYDYPQWFLDDLARDEDRKLARLRKLPITGKTLFKCPVHGIYEQRASDHIKLTTGERRYGCPLCGLESSVKKRMQDLEDTRPEYPQWFIDELVDEEDKKKALSRVLKTSDIVTVRCPIHGLYKRRVADRIRISTGERRYGCQKCYQGMKHSSLEDDVLKEMLFYAGEEKYELNRRGYIGNNYEGDIVFPERKLIIEVNGSYYHKSLTRFSKPSEIDKPIDYHLDKFRLAKEKGFRLIGIYDVDWKKPNVREYMSRLLVEKERVFARSCDIVLVDRDEATEFCDLYHIQKSERSATIFIGLKKDGMLLALMSFGVKRFSNEEGTYELLRYCVRGGYYIVGGAEKLLRQFEGLKVGCTKLVTYSDNDFFSGNVYSKLGFKFDGYTSAYYWYYRGEEITRYQAQLKNLEKRFSALYEEAKDIAGNKEDYILSKAGAFKVYRAGHTRWVKTYE